MSNKTQLSTNNTKLASLIETLQGKASGGGSVETCTVVLNASTSTYRPYYYSYMTVDDEGNITGAAVGSNSAIDVTLNNVVCGSVVTVYWYGWVADGTHANATQICTANNKYFHAYLVTAPAGGTATIINAAGGAG